MRTDKTSVVDIIKDMEPWVNELMLLRELALSLDLKETIKWGGPVYTLNDKNVLGIGGFKNYACIWFFQGAFLSDPDKVLVNANEGRTRGLRQWRFASMKEIKPAKVKTYMKEAVENMKKGKSITPQKKVPLVIPELYQKAFKKNKALKTAFEKFTPGKQREFVEYVTEPKLEETKVKRVEKTIPMILKGVGLNDKYR
jgi:uncharacterized protein YdeI (YjbR/CyaY-like superfamily)